MELTNYQEYFFQYLYALVKEHKIAYVCENGKVFLAIQDAKHEEYDYMERKHYKLLWAEVNIDNVPLNNEELKTLLEGFKPEEQPKEGIIKKSTLNVDESVINEFNALKEARKNSEKKTKGRPPKEQ